MDQHTGPRDALAAEYFESLPFEPYPVQEEALLTWFTSPRGVLVCAPTGTGKTMIAEAAMFEALRTGKRAYYTTPLIALTEQKLTEIRAAAVRWGYAEDDVGLVTGNRRVNAEAPLLVVVAEILFNRLLHREAFDFSDVSAVVMDEFHSFNDPERGVVWELTLGLLPEQVRLMLLSATVGNAYEFVSWLDKCHSRRLELVQSDQRKVPLTYQWVGDQLLTELLEEMADGDEVNRRTPTLVFCFNRDECWNVAEQLKGKRLLADGQQRQLAAALETFDWSQGVGPKLKQVLLRGVGVHHAGLLPRYKRVVEDLFQRKLLSVTVCTETLAAGINLPARSVVLPELIKGPPDKKRVIDPSLAHQMFGRAGRPQFDTQGYIYALAHEDDVRILRWREKYDQIPEDTKDPGLLKAKKALKRKMPTRRENQTYWSEGQFKQLCAAPAAKLQSRGPVPWRLLAYMLDASPDVELIRTLVAKRLMPANQLEGGQKTLDRMLLTLAAAGYVTLDPPPPPRDTSQPGALLAATATPPAGSAAASSPPRAGTLDFALGRDAGKSSPARSNPAKLNPPSRTVRPADGRPTGEEVPAGPPPYRPNFAHRTERLDRLLGFRSINPLYGDFLVSHLGIADRAERIQALESVLEMPRSLGPAIRVPHRHDLPPGTLATTRLDVQLLQLGLATPEELTGVEMDEEQRERARMFPEERVFVLSLAEKLRRLFDHDFPGVHGVFTDPTWVVGSLLLEFGGNFNKYVTTKSLQKQEGIVFRHLLRFLLLLSEFTDLEPVDTTRDQWQDDWFAVREELITSCREVDPSSTDKTLEEIDP